MDIGSRISNASNAFWRNKVRLCRFCLEDRKILIVYMLARHRDVLLNPTSLGTYRSLPHRSASRSLSSCEDRTTARHSLQHYVHARVCLHLTSNDNAYHGSLVHHTLYTRLPVQIIAALPILQPWRALAPSPVQPMHGVEPWCFHGREPQPQC